jgi:hypothetical protein
MLRAILFFMLGIFGTALLSATVSVYILHDVDRDMIGHLNEAFTGLCTESILFTVIVGGGVRVLTLLGRLVFRLKGYFPRAKLALFLGIGVIVLQYPWDLLGRTVLPKFADSFLSYYLFIAIVLCSIVLIHDNFRQMKLSQSAAASFDR